MEFNRVGIDINLSGLDILDDNVVGCNVGSLRSRIGLGAVNQGEMGDRHLLAILDTNAL